MEVRRATKDDLTEILSLYEELYGALGDMGYPYGLDSEAARAVLLPLFDSRFCRIFAAVDADHIAGFVFVSYARMNRKLSLDGESMVGTINNICVRSDCRRLGAASLLLEAAEGFLRDNGVRLCQSEVAMQNFPSLGLFERSGYEKLSIIHLKRL